ncbi:hypothetical protein SH580_17300 [Coraliomargarita algicola]|uniref:Uncharacterized protein n=1 Tax=Coraliomargarita algicola TaxID=3092156 RepID=A0ABZ0RJ29_9BACT|nr:hypothetical protein [Coraliomargarita sp. J2-16]WPJ95181.1 hypothetical protein SH580_17300 [Coraliomargarita sp. J2-16]
MAFIVLLLLTMTTYVRVETTTASSRAKTMLARENAKLSLMVALGQLQRTVGVDQRVTANGDVFTGALVGPSIRSPHWLGAWDSSIENWSDLNAEERIARGHWLVSGNSGLLPGDPDYRQPMDDLTAEDRVVLVGGDGTDDLDDVLVVKESLNDASGKIAYWVADESMKARVNLIDDYSDSSDHYELTKSFQGAQRSGIEYMNSLASYPVNGSEVLKLFGLSELIQASKSNDAVTDDRLIKKYYHDLTTWSEGLLVDVKNGGLKRDLTQAFEYRHIFDEYFLPYDENSNPNDAATLPLDYIENLYLIEEDTMTANGFDSGLGIDRGGPNWSILRSYYRQYKPMGNAIGSQSVEAPEGDELLVDQRIDQEDYTALNGDSPGYLAPYVDFLSSSTGYPHKKYIGFRHTEPAHTFAPLLRTGKPYQAEPNFVGMQGKNFVRPTADNYQMQSMVTPILARMQMGYALNDGPYGVELVITPVFGIYNPYNSELTVNRLIVRWDPNPIVRITVDGDTVEFGVREVMPVNGQGIVDYFFKDDPSQSGVKPITIGPGEIKYYGINTNTTDYPNERKLANGLAMFWEDADGNVSQARNDTAADRVYLTPYVAGGGGLVIPLMLSSHIDAVPKRGSNRIANVDGPAPIEWYRDTNYGNTQPTKLPTWNLTENEISILERLSPTDGVTEAPSFSFEMSLLNDLGATLTVGYYPWDIKQGTGKIFSDFDGADAISVERSFANLSSASYQDELLAIGFWLKTTQEYEVPWRNLIDSNVRAINANSEWDGFFDDAGYSVLSTFTTEDPNGTRGILTDSDIQADADASGYWGDSIGVDGQSRVILFDRPRTPLLSLGNLQHANLGRYNFDPSYMLGNSYANVRIPLQQTLDDSHQVWTYSADDSVSPVEETFTLFDTSYLVNEKVWDRYFFSGFTDSITEEDFEAFLAGQSLSGNQRYQFAQDSGELKFSDLVDRIDDSQLFRSLAGYLRVKGAFNVNSVSVSAWKAVLAGLSIEEFPLYDGTTTRADGGLVVSRFTWPYSGKVNLGMGSSLENFWKGVRELEEEEVESLAEAIVEQVKARGPFLSMADFVNRRLSDDEAGKSGVLQAALDDPDQGLNTASKLNGLSAESSNAISGAGFYDVFPDTNMQAAGFPGYVLQGDLLQRLAPFMSVRGDTFLIRAYGESNDPLTGELVSAAYCEAVVQRSVMPVEAGVDNLENEMIYPTGDFGRSFKIVAFRWLNEDEI